MSKNCAYEGLLQKIHGKVLGALIKSMDDVLRWWEWGGGREETNIVPYLYKGKPKHRVKGVTLMLQVWEVIFVKTKTLDTK